MALISTFAFDFPALGYREAFEISSVFWNEINSRNDFLSYLQCRGQPETPS